MVARLRLPPAARPAALGALVLAALVAPAHAGPDAGVPAPDDAGIPAPDDAGPDGDIAGLVRATSEAVAQASRLGATARAFDALPDDRATPPPELAGELAGLDLTSVATAAAKASELEARAAVAAAESAELTAAAAAAAAGERRRYLEAAANRAAAAAARARAVAGWLRRTQGARAGPPSPADALSAARAELEAVRAAQDAYEERLVARRSRLADLAAHERRLLSSFAAQDAVAGGPIHFTGDPRFTELSGELAQVRVAALEALRARLTSPPPPPSPPAIAPGPTLDALRERREALERRAGELDAEARRIRVLELDTTTGLAVALTKAFEAELAASPRLRGELRSWSATTVAELRGEAVQVAVVSSHWALSRLSQLAALPDHVTDWSGIAHVLWLALELALLLALLRWSLARWPSWMQQIIEAVGRTLSYGESAMLLVRLAEAARRFGPPLLVLAFALAGHRLLGPAASEIELAFALLIAVAALRAQLRLVEGLCERLGARAQERERERLLAEFEEAETEPEPGPAAEPERATSGWTLFPITWRRLTRYVGVVVVLLLLTHHAVGRGVFWGLLVRWAWFGAIPLALLFLRTWRDPIVAELLKRSPGGAGTLGRWAERHAHRFYGVVIVFAATLVVLGRRSVSFVKNHVFALDSTRRLLAFLFRRRVQKHAREHGRVLEKPHQLPEAIREQFPEGGVDPGDRPHRPAPLLEIVRIHAGWLEDGADGSVAVIGARGRGKSTLLGLLPTALETEVAGACVRDKITRPRELVPWLARALAIEGEPTTEEELIAALRRGERRVVAVDDCHNLFLREVGGFAAWECFTRVVNETADHVFWIVAVSQAAWEYLTNVSGGVAYFRRAIEIPPWTETELRRMILGRMRRAGYRTNFSDLLVTRLEGVRLSSQIIRTSQGYFRLLWDYTDGNPGLACFFWLRSLVPDVENRSVRVHLFAAPQIEELEKLPDDIAFVLTAVVEHEQASAAELAAITNLSPQLCRFAVRFGSERGYLERAAGRYHVSPLWHQTVITYLKRKHLLYS